MQPAQQNNAALAALKREMDEAADALEAGDLTRAAATAKSLLTKAPSEYRVLQLAATIALAQNQPAVAADYFRRAMSVCRMPLDAARTLHGLGISIRAMGDLDAAWQTFKRASQAHNGNLVSMLEWARTLNQIAFNDILNGAGKREEAEQVLRDAMRRFPEDPRAATELGIIMLSNRRESDALVLFEEVLEKNPDFAPALFNRSVALTMLGQTDKAEEAIEHALTTEPRLEGYYHFSNLHTFTQDDPWFTKVKDHASESVQISAKIDVEFALAKAYEDIKDYTKAFEHLETANRTKRSIINYDIANDQVRIERITALFTPDFFARFRGKVSSGQINPIFIVGMPRTGSTLLEQMLAGHPKITPGGELPYMLGIARAIGAAWESRKEQFSGQDSPVILDMQQGADTYERLTAQLRGTSEYFTDKLPGNYQFIGLIHLMFPNAKIINCLRDPIDACLSCYKKLFLSAVPYSFDLVELGKYYNLYQRLMRHWKTVLPDQILDVEYETLLENPEQELRRALSFCGLDFDPACLEFHKVDRSIATASAIQVRKPLYKDSMQRWKKYESQLTPLLNALEIGNSSGANVS